jgi:hypothetical protein
MKNSLKIRKWLRTGELTGEPKTVAKVLEQAGNALDRCESHEIMGEVVFEAEDGQVYVGAVEFVIDKINPEYLKELEEEEA